MTIVKFDHYDYGEMTTLIEHWVECHIFDAWSEEHESCVVAKDDCTNPEVVEL